MTVFYLDDVGVHESRNPLVLADDASVLIVRAVAVSPPARVALLHTRLSATADHIVQPDLS